MPIEKQLQRIRAVQEYLAYYGKDYRIDALGIIKHSDGSTTPAIVLHFQGQSKGVFYSLESMIEAIEDLKLQAIVKALA